MTAPRRKWYRTQAAITHQDMANVRHGERSPALEFQDRFRAAIEQHLSQGWHVVPQTTKITNHDEPANLRSVVEAEAELELHEGTAIGRFTMYGADGSILYRPDQPILFNPQWIMNEDKRLFISRFSIRFFNWCRPMGWGMNEVFFLNENEHGRYVLCVSMHSSLEGVLLTPIPRIPDHIPTDDILPFERSIMGPDHANECEVYADWCDDMRWPERAAMLREAAERIRMVRNIEMNIVGRYVSAGDELEPGVRAVRAPNGPDRNIRVREL